MEIKLNKQQRDSLTEVMTTVIRQVIVKTDLQKTCLDCVHFHESTEKCLMFLTRPPARIIANGCEHWEDLIPF